MRTNVGIETSDELRSKLADFIDGRESKRLATRKEVTSTCLKLLDQHMAGIEEAVKEPEQIELFEPQASQQSLGAPEIEIDPEDRHLLKGKSPGYIRGWYKVKRRGERL